MPLVNHITYGLSSLRTPVALTPYADTRATSVSFLLTSFLTYRLQHGAVAAFDLGVLAPQSMQVEKFDRKHALAAA